MTRRAQYADTAALGRFPLRPGKPLVHRRQNGAWGFSCDCLHHTRPGHGTPHGTHLHNCASWADALRKAHAHIRHWHKTPAQYETEALEALYALPAAPSDTEV